MRELHREAAVIEIWDMLTDVGAALHTTDAKRDAIRARMDDGWLVSSCWVVRGTRRNRVLLRSLPGLVKARFPVRQASWLAALCNPATAMPLDAGLIWTTAAGDVSLALAPHAARHSTAR